MLGSRVSTMTSSITFITDGFTSTDTIFWFVTMPIQMKYSFTLDPSIGRINYSIIHVEISKVPAYTALVENGTYFNVKDEGNFAWDTFTVKKGGIVGFLKITKAMHIWNSETRVKYFGNLYGDQIHMVLLFCSILPV
jgi:hypothetical protein